jgi:MYXO-CTERM domain-containing protein
MTTTTARVLALAGALMTCGAAHADTIFDTGTPEPGFLGYYGFDVFVDQSVAIAFTPGQDYTLDSIGVWMMSNDSSPGAPYTLSIRTDAGAGMTIPGDTVIESWDVQTGAVGWNPILETVNSVLNPVLTAGTTYWIVAESDSPAFVDAVWVASAQDEPVWHSIQNALNPDGAWISGYTQGAPGMIVSGTVVPTPGVLAALGVAGLAGTRRRR